MALFSSHHLKPALYLDFSKSLSIHTFIAYTVLSHRVFLPLLIYNSIISRLRADLGPLCAVPEVIPKNAYGMIFFDIWEAENTAVANRCAMLLGNPQ